MKARILCAAIALICSSPIHAQDIDVTHYKAELEFNLLQEIISGTVEISLRNSGGNPLDALALHLVNLNIIEAEVNGVSVTWQQSDPDLTIDLASPFAPNDSIVLELRYSGHAAGEPAATPWGGCFWNMDGVTFSMGVGFFANYVSMMRHWMPSHDIPSDKATFDVTFTVPDTLLVAAAGLLQSVDKKNGLASYRWLESHPTATYLFNYSISDYVRIQDTWQGIPMEYYVRRKDSVKGATYFTTVSDMMEAFTSRFGAYPFDKVGYCVTPIGAMEHQTMISYPQSNLNQFSEAGSTAAHELAHQWWGDWVTPEDFRHAWLSEGFAVFSELVYREFMGGRAAYVSGASDAGRNYRTYVAPREGVFPLYDFPREAPSSNYPQTIYQKGGAVLIMLREIMGQDAFFEGLRQYSQTYGYGNAATAHFQAIMEQRHGESLEWFFNEWVYEKGWPDYTFEVLKDGQNPLRVRVLQTQSQGEIPLFQMPIPCFAVTRALDTLRMVLMNNAVASQEFTFPNLRSDSVLSVRFDPERLILSRQNTRILGVDGISPAEGFLLSPSFPNPVRRGMAAQIPFTIAERHNISIAIYDAAGRNIATIAGHEYLPGDHSIAIPTDSLHAGRYWVYVRSGQRTAVEQLVIN